MYVRTVLTLQKQVCRFYHILGYLSFIITSQQSEVLSPLFSETYDSEHSRFPMYSKLQGFLFYEDAIVASQ